MEPVELRKVYGVPSAAANSTTGYAEGSSRFRDLRDVPMSASRHFRATTLPVVRSASRSSETDDHARISPTIRKIAPNADTPSTTHRRTARPCT